MRVASIAAFGDPSVIEIRDVPTPRNNASEVLIAVDAAGVGTWDPKIRSGEWAEGDTKFPLILGTDGSGRVVAVGSRVSRIAVGDRVYGYSFENPKGGWYAEYVVMSASNVARVPAGLDRIEAGALPAIGLTALQGCDDTLELETGESVLVHGASGNVGMIAVQFARLRGARVIATASGRDGVELVRGLGVDAVVDGKSGDIEAAIDRFAPDGLDAVLAFVGGTELTRILDKVKDGGRVAYPNGVEPEPRKRRGLRIKSYDAESGARQFDRLNEAVEQGSIRVPIAEAFPLQAAAKAHQRLERDHVLGKIVLDVSQRG